MNDYHSKFSEYASHHIYIYRIKEKEKFFLVIDDS